MTRAQILSEAMSLSAAERDALADELWRSVHGSDDEIEQAWAEEVERRIDAYERGEVKAIPGEQVMEELRARLAAKGQGVSRP